MKKTLRKVLPVLALVLVVAVASVGGTLAWLTATTQEVKNTFTVGDVSIKLEETGTTRDEKTGNDSKTFHIIPGTDIVKDPTVTVDKGSEDCYLFVKVDVANWPDAKEDDGETLKVKYEIAAGWTLVDGTTNVYYREVSADAAKDQSFDVLKTLKPVGDDGKKYTVIVSENLTKEEAAKIGKNNNAPTLTFKAYAIQKEGFADAKAAWAKLSTTAGN